MTRVLAGRRILVVDDDFFLAADLQDFLEREGCTVAGPVPSVEGAVTCLLEGAPDAAILDVDLETEDTGPIAAELDAAGVPFVFITGHGRSVLPVEHQARPLIVKPYDERELRDKLAACMGDERNGVEGLMALPPEP